jgi:hypothetical protein
MKVPGGYPPRRMHEGQESARRRLIAFREYPAAKPGRVADAVVAVLEYIADGACLVSTYDSNAVLIEEKRFDRQTQADWYLDGYGEEHSFEELVRAGTWRMPFTSWHYVPQVDDFDAFIAGEIHRGHPVTPYRCPCCGYKTLPERSNYDTCEVCWWEDEGDRDPYEVSGPNHMTLAEGRENFRRFGASKERHKAIARPPWPHEL